MCTSGCCRAGDRAAGAPTSSLTDGRCGWISTWPTACESSSRWSRRRRLSSRRAARGTWTLRRALPPGTIERANGRLAYALGGDLRAGDAARILRPPETVNFKHDRPVRLVHYEPSPVG